jgi:integrase
MRKRKKKKMSEILESKLDQFVKRGGYETVKQIKRGKRKGKFRNISEASRKTGISRPTIYAILEKYPEKPSKTKPKFMESLETSEGFKAIEEMYKARISANGWYNIKRTLRDAVTIIGYNKDPVSWTEEDYRTLWYHAQFHSEECKGIGKKPATALRQLMRATNNHNLLAKFKYNNPPEGKKKNWFLHTSEIKDIVAHIENRETLLLLFTGISTGARHSGLESIKIENLDFNDNAIEVYEKKVRGHVLKFPPVEVMKLIERYVNDENLKATDNLFQHGYAWHLNKLKKAGRKAGVKKTVSTHILKHTFVSQAHRHGVSGSTISNQTGTELRCLVKFYRAESEDLLRSEMQGIEYKHKPFHVWVRELSYYFRARYEALKRSQQ